MKKTKVIRKIKKLSNKTRQGTYLSLKSDNTPERIYKIPDEKKTTISAIEKLYRNAYLAETGLTPMSQHNIGRSARKLLAARNLHSILKKGAQNFETTLVNTDKRSLLTYKKSIAQGISRNATDTQRIEKQLHKLSGNISTTILLLNDRQHVIGEIKIAGANITQITRTIANTRFIGYVFSSNNKRLMETHLKQTIPNVEVKKTSAGDEIIKSIRIQTHYIR